MGVKHQLCTVQPFGPTAAQVEQSIGPVGTAAPEQPGRLKGSLFQNLSTRSFVIPWESRRFAPPLLVALALDPGVNYHPLVSWFGTPELPLSCSGSFSEL